MTAQTAAAPVIDRAYLTANHPDLVAAIAQESADTAHASGYASGQAAGATAERERIQSVLSQEIPGHTAIIQRLAFDGKTTGPEAAVQVLAAEKTLRVQHQQAQAAAPAPVDAALPPDPQPRDFETCVADAMAQGKTRGQAIAAVASAQPDLHRAYLARVNRAA